MDHLMNIDGPPYLVYNPGPTIRKFMAFRYSIVKDSSADLGVNSKIVQIRPTVKAVCTKISKNFFCIFVNILIFLSENKKVHFFYFEYLS